MNIFGIGLPEMAVIFVVALLVFGPKKLPEIGRSLGKAIRGFQEASNEFQTEFKREAEQLEQAVKKLEQAVKTTAELEPKQIEAAPSEQPKS
jgi:sec-independent protein translocase protein TatA